MSSTVGDLRDGIFHSVLYITILHSQIKLGAHRATKRLPMRTFWSRQRSQNQNRGDLPCDRPDSAPTPIHEWYSGFSTPSSAFSQLAPFRNNLPPSVVRITLNSQVYHKNPGGKCTFSIHHTLKHFLQPEISWETLTATRSRVGFLLQEGTAGGVKGIRLVCSSEREMSAGSPALPKAPGWVNLTLTA